MSAFEQQLDEEIEKRGLKKVDEERISEQQPKPAKKKIFSFKSFFTGTLLGVLFLAGLCAWAWLKAGSTLQDIQDALPSKTAIVKQGASGEDYTSIQPVLTMQPAVNVTTEDGPDSLNEKPRVPGQPVSFPTQQDLVRNKNGLVPAPVPDLFETTSAGIVPIKRISDGVTPFEAYKRPFKLQEGKIKLSVVITDIGLSKQTTNNIIKDFSPDVTLAFSPYAFDIKTQVDQAREAGHETWLVLPMETNKYPMDDPGPSTILLNASVSQNKQRLTSILSSANGYIGFVAQKNHAFRAEDSVTNPSISEIFERGLAITDSNTNVSSFVARAAAMNDYPHAKNNFWLDDSLTPLALNQKIRQLIEYGQVNDRVIIMLNPYPASLKALKKFLDSNASKDFQLAPLSAQVVYGQP